MSDPFRESRESRPDKYENFFCIMLKKRNDFRILLKKLNIWLNVFKNQKRVLHTVSWKLSETSFAYCQLEAFSRLVIKF